MPKKENWDEPKVKWGKTKARKLLYKDIMEGKVPRKAKNLKNKSTMKLSIIYRMRLEYQEYHYSKFSSRLSSLRKSIDEKEGRKALDKQAFDNYVSNHLISYFSHKGYIQWQGSLAQEKALEDMQNKVHCNTKWAVWYGSRSAFYENFSLRVFSEKIRQEIQTAKYLHTLEVRGKDARRKTIREERMKDHTNDPEPVH